MLTEARRREPALRLLAHKNGSKTRKPADIPVAKKHLLVNAFAAALLMMTRGGANDGPGFYAPLLALRLHESPEGLAHVPAVAAAIERWRGN